ncbi:M48 family metallopeptidase [Pedobacter punctiformis]|uniref:M48 family metallopeptidase n=1 Tax=Pedobacter punctiformis TaxID=3004097 RepID=A0ABT4L3X0_9SPHI|nr:M48 family metallopeptidase [Pedobacter sp. HCMS5-2]MCZ4242620.1 M48 family metallopeptidase [Pedobacter sp. HCMS5-2]
MTEDALKPSKQFQKMATKSVWAIALFIFTYLFLIALSIGLTILSCYAGIMLVAAKPMFITFMLCAGLCSFGFLIVFFLLKFIFSSNKIDRSHLTEITEAEQPRLFNLINSIVEEVGTHFPKKVYVSSEVNASVFYDSSFWSMFFPVKKNLQVGLGLMNTISTDELRAILAHEFGHFSQRSMKVGSYVYNVNQIIYNMLYNNEGYNNLVARLASLSSYFAIFVVLAGKVVSGIQYLLTKVYDIVNLSHLALSREMEFHADTVAAHVAGSKPLITSLLRLQLADYSLDTVFNYYSKKISVNERTDNIYPQQYFIMNFLAKVQRLSIDGGLPQISEDYNKKFNKSRLVLKDQWASHPGTEDRIAHLKKLNIPLKNHQEGIAIDLLNDKEDLLKKITEGIFSRVNYEKSPAITSFKQFEEEFVRENAINSFPEVFNAYFDYRNPITEFEDDVFEKPVQPFNINAEELFSDENLALIFESRSAITDLDTIDRIDAGAIKIKSFDYDGQKYTVADCKKLIDQLKKEVESNDKKLKDFDHRIFEYFRFKASEQQQTETFKAYYSKYISVAETFNIQQKVHQDLLDATSFMNATTPFEIIRQKMLIVKNEEVKFKEKLSELLESADYESLITPEIKERSTAYLNVNFKYFAGTLYFDEELKVLFAAMDDFAYLITEYHFKTKKALLGFEASMEVSVLNA